MVDRAKDEELFTEQQDTLEGGVITTRDPGKLLESEIQMAENAVVLAGRVAKRKGFENFLTTASFSGNARRAIRFKPENGEDRWLVQIGTTIWSITDDGYEIRNLTTVADYDCPMVQWVDKVYFSDGTAGLESIAPDHAGSFATANMDSAGANNDVLVTADNKGHYMHAYQVRFVEGGANRSLDADLRTESGQLIINVQLETDGSGNSLSTANEVVAEANGTAAISALVTFSADEGTGAGVVDAIAATDMSGGIDVGAPSTVAVEDATYNFRYLAVREAQEALWGIDNDDPDTLRWCDTGDPTNWSTGNAGEWTPGGVFKSLIEVGRAMVGFQETRIFRIDGTNPDTWEVMRVLAEGLGCVAPETTIEVEGVIVYYSPRGLAFYDGSKPSVLSDGVYEGDDSARSLLPSDPDLYDEAFCVDTKSHIWFFYKSATTETGNDRAMVVDFRNNTWSGPFTLQVNAFCGAYDPGGDSADARELHIGEATDFLRQYDGYQDDGNDYTWKVRTRTVDAGSPTLDKVFDGMRGALYASGACTINMTMYFEDETTTRAAGCARAISVAGESHETYEKRIPAGAGRAKSAYVQFDNDDDVEVELSNAAVDLFFVRTR